jgi:hypothetical protein
MTYNVILQSNPFLICSHAYPIHQLLALANQIMKSLINAARMNTSGYHERMIVIKSSQSGQDHWFLNTTTQWTGSAPLHSSVLTSDRKEFSMMYQLPVSCFRLLLNTKLWSVTCRLDGEATPIQSWHDSRELWFN